MTWSLEPAGTTLLLGFTKFDASTGTTSLFVVRHRFMRSYSRRVLSLPNEWAWLLRPRWVVDLGLGARLQIVAHFSSPWNVFDFFIVLVGYSAFVNLGSSGAESLRALRALRALRPLRTVSQVRLVLVRKGKESREA